MGSQNIEPLLGDERDEESGFREYGDLGVVEESSENARMMCATTRCGLQNPCARAADAKEKNLSSRKLTRAIIFCLVFVAIEVTGGILANSLAIQTDAAHLLSDVTSFAISLFAIWAGGWEHTPRQTFGFHRLEILGALVSIQLIWLVTGILVYEAIKRLFSTSEPVDGRLMFFIATLGFLVNLGMLFLLGDEGHGHSHDHSHGPNHSHSHGEEHGLDGHRHEHEDEHSSGEHNHDGHGDRDHDISDHGNCTHSRGDEGQDAIGHGEEGHHATDHFHKTRSVTIDRELSSSSRGKGNINVQGAYLHVLGDLIQSIGVMVGGAVIWYKPEWKVIDLLCTLLFSALVLATTIKMLRFVLEVLMESTPREIDARAVESGLLEISGVVAVHDLHIWNLTMGKTLLACHIRIKREADADSLLQQMTDFCEKKYNLTHVTIQVERDF